MFRPRLIIEILAAGVLLGLAVPGVAALSGIGHRWVDIFAQFTAPALTAAVVASLAVLLLKFRRAAMVGGAAVLVLLAAVWPQWTPPKGRAAPDAPVMTVFSANLWARNTDTARMRRSIEAADADVLVLIEVGPAADRDLEALLAGYPHRVANLREGSEGDPARSIIASRWPVTEIADRNDGLASVGAVVAGPLGPVNVLGVHLTRPWPFQYQWGQITQVMAINDIRRDLTGPVIVAGDFNSVSSARIGRQMKQEVGLIPAPGFPGTWPSFAPSFAGMTIDQVWRSPDLTLLDRRLGKPTGSDHRPVVTRFSRARP